MRPPSSVLPQSTVPLSALLRSGSRPEHEAAEGTPFLRDLMGPGVPAARYAGYLRRLLPVYESLERLARCAPADHLVAAFDDRALDRAPALRADLVHWAGPSGPSGPVDGPSPAVRAYVGRLRAAADTPDLLLAHHYVRYLGDLAGGQAVGRVLRRRHDLGPHGAEFHVFPGVPRPPVYRAAYRARLDSLPLDEAARERLVAEVRTAFGLSLGLLQEA